MHVSVLTALRRNREWLIKSVMVPWILPTLTWITVVILELIHEPRAPTSDGRGAFIRTKPIGRLVRPLPWWLWITFGWSHGPGTGDASFKCLPYQLSMVGSAPTMVVTGDGESGFDPGEGAWETATTSKEGSRRANYPILTQGGSDNK